jgi:hypothetical protein
MADDDFFDVVKNGRPGAIMPAWGQLGLSDEETWGLVDFIRSEPSRHRGMGRAGLFRPGRRHGCIALKRRDYSVSMVSKKALPLMVPT